MTRARANGTDAAGVQQHPGLNGRRALVTGAASGIGEAIAHRLAAEGANLVICDVDETAAHRVADEVGGEVWALDLSRTQDLYDLALDVDVVVSNAGIQHVAPIEEFAADRFAFMMRLMVEAPFLLVRAALPAMYERGWGRVVHMSSAHGLRASPFKSAYVTAKHAVEGFSKVTALEGAAHGVTSNCVCPGYVRTPLVERQIAAQAEVHGLAEEQVLSEVLLARSAVKRLMEPEEVAAAVSYLCSEDAASVTGSSLVLDGGWSAS